jgi:guanylate kinase
LNNLYIIAGKSGSGKDSVSDKLCTDYELRKVHSYTTRKKRKDELNTHIFVTTKEFDKIRNDLVAYTMFNGKAYGATNKQVNESDLYILDKKGILYFKEHYNNYKPFKIIYLDVPEFMCRERMKKRGDSTEEIEKRIQNDRIEFKGIEKLSDVIISNKYFLSCVCDIWEYIQKCEVDSRKKMNKNR